MPFTSNASFESCKTRELKPKTKQKLNAPCIHESSISPQLWQDFIALTFSRQTRRHALILISELKHLSEQCHEGVLT